MDPKQYFPKRAKGKWSDVVLSSRLRVTHPNLRRQFSVSKKRYKRNKHWVGPELDQEKTTIRQWSVTQLVTRYPWVKSAHTRGDGSIMRYLPRPSRDIEFSSNNPIFTSQSSQVIKFSPIICFVIWWAINCHKPKRVTICQKNMYRYRKVALNNLMNSKIKFTAKNKNTPWRIDGIHYGPSNERWRSK